MSKIVIITEEMKREMDDLLAMTQFKFKANIRKFLAALLEDPTGAEPDAIFTHNGLDKNKLIKALVDNKVMTKKMTIDDHDENGNPHTARMIVKYSVPKDRFNERLDALYDVLFPDVDAKINEDGGGATSCSGVDGNGFGSGEFTVPAFGKVIRQKKKEVGGNPYTLTEKVVRISETQARLITEAVTGKDAEKAAAIYAYCLDDKEEDYCILCAKRVEGDEKGKWNPPMGHLHVGESPKDGAVRECEEESGVKIPKSQLHLGSTEDWGKNYWVILDGTVKDWPVGEGDGENSKFEWKNVYGLFWGKDKDLEWAWNTKDFVYRFAPAELDLDESVNRLGTRYLYHKSPIAFRKSILSTGLKPSVGDSYKCHYDDRDDLTPYVFLYDHNTVDGGEYDSTYDDDIYQVDCSYLDQDCIGPDPEKALRGCYTYSKPIPKEAIKLIYKGSTKDSDDLSKHAHIYNVNKPKMLAEGKKKNFVNMDVELRKGGRSAVKMSVEDFKQEMIHAYHQYSMEQDEKYKSSLQLTPSPGNFVYTLCYGRKTNKKSKYASALYDDIWDGKYKFDTENVDAIGGIKMSKKGFPYIQCDAGGDWECPVCFFVYFDGHKFRGYVPLKGNALNRNEKHAFSGGGNEPDAKFVQKELGLSYEEADHMCDDIDYNVDACLEDFLSRVDVKGTYKKRDFTKDEEEFKKYRKEKIDAENKRREEAERIRQMNAQRDAEELNNEEGDINEATATGTGGLPGEFTVPFPTDKDDPSLDRTPGDTMGMHDRVGKSNVGESKQSWRDNPLFTIGKYKGIEKIKVINSEPDYCLWLHENALDKISNTPFSAKELALLDVSYYRKHKKFPIRSPYTPRYAKINGKYVSKMDKDELQYVYENGNDEFKWLVRQEHKNRGWERRDRGAPAFQSDDVGDEAWMRNHLYEKKKRKKVVKNDEGEVVPEFCKKCGGKVGTYICGEPIYKCSECGEYYGTMPFKR